MEMTCRGLIVYDFTRTSIIRYQSLTHIKCIFHESSSFLRVDQMHVLRVL